MDIITPKQVAGLVGRSVNWVCKQCREKRFPTLPPHTRPYLIPRNALFRGSELEKQSKNS
jgi:hypothetical protein